MTKTFQQKGGRKERKGEKKDKKRKGSTGVPGLSARHRA
jgi:hypothetical protein